MTSKRAWTVAVASTFVVMGAVGFARFGYTLILPRMVVALELSDSQAGSAATANMIGYLLFSLIGGVLASRFGPRAVILSSLVLTAVSLFCTGLSNSHTTLLFWRFLAGAGGGANVPMMGLISGWFDARRRGLASGIAVGGSSLALLFTGAVLPGIMASSASGWQRSWFLLGTITIVIAIAAGFAVKNAPSASPKVVGPARKIHKSRRLWLLSVIYLFFGFSYVIFATFYAEYLVGEVGLSERTVGTLWSLIGGVSIVSGFLWGTASDRFGRGIALAIIFLIQAVAYGVFSIWQAMPGYILGTIFFGLTAWSIPAVMGATVGDIYGPKSAPAVFGFVTLVFGVGQALGPAIAGIVADTRGSYELPFLLAAIVAFAGAPLSLRLRLSRD